nr:DNA helicase [Tanacetum cinerariifolium]
MSVETFDYGLDASANANNHVNGTRLFGFEDYRNQDHLQKKQPVDEAIGTNIQLPTRNNIAKVAPSDVDIVDPYSLQTCDILRMGQRKRPKRKSKVAHRQYQSQRINNSPKRQCTCVCRQCVAMFRECEKVTSASHIFDLGYNKCCYGRCIVLRPPQEYSQLIKEFYESTHIMENIRAYNQMFNITSLGANVDKSIKNGKGSYVFRISGQIYHWIGSMCQEEGKTQSPRYMFAHYLDALTICRVHGSPSFFITFTCNAKWPKIKEFMKPFQQLTTADRADIVDRIFQKKVRDYITFVRDSNTFGDVTRVLYTIEFQKRGHPHCHSLLWINGASRAQQDVTGEDFGLPTPPEDMLLILQNRLLMEEINYDPQLLVEEKTFLIPRLNKDQKLIFDEITCAVRHNVQKLIFVYGHGGTGKTFLWKAITSALRSEEKIVLTVAALGKSIMLGGDFRQTLYVKKKASKPKILDASITSSYLWPRLKTYTLMENMRLHQSQTTEAKRIHIQMFSTWLLNIGNGTIGDPDETDDQNTFAIHVPPDLCIPDSNTGLAALIDFIYDQQTLQTPTSKDLQMKAIISLKKENADMINAQVLSLVNRQQHVYLSLDEATPHGNDGGETKFLYPSEYSNSLNFVRFPPHRLELKVGAPIILLRNLNISGGLCNGTQLIVTQLLSKVIEARIITGTRISKNHFGQNAKPGYLNFTLDAILQATAQPLLALPATEPLKSPAVKVLEGTSIGDNPATIVEEASQSAETDVEVLGQTPEEKTKKARRGLFQDTDA